MEDQLLIGIDVGTTKVCTLVAREEAQGQLRILGVGIEPSQGLRKGVVVDLEAAAQAVARSVDKAERTSGVEILSALVSLAGSNVSSVNSRGVVGVTGRVIDRDDVARAVDAARAVAIPHNREIVHVIQRSFNVDGQDGIRMPIGMHGYRLEVETHIITATAASVENLRQCIGAAGVEVAQFVLNPLASAEVALSETERQMGVVICDVGGGTTDLCRRRCLAHGGALHRRQPHHLGHRPGAPPAQLASRRDQAPARARQPRRSRPGAIFQRPAFRRG
jgi:cell division protein FtsA